MSCHSRPARKQQGWNLNSGVWLQSRLSLALGHLSLAVPGGIAAESLTFTPLEDMIFLKWEEPQEPNGLITQYEVGLDLITAGGSLVEGGRTAWRGRCMAGQK